MIQGPEDSLEVKSLVILILTLFWLSLDLKYQTKIFAAREDVVHTPISASFNPVDYTPTRFENKQDLAQIIQQIITLLENKQLPIEGSISLTLIDVTTGKQASYLGDDLYYPASLVKLFWLVYLEEKIENKQIPFSPKLEEDIKLMIRSSDNGAGSRILDLITDTQSGVSLNPEDLGKWLAKRQQINRYFRQQGYQQINLEQKTYPIPELNYSQPTGRDLQLRGDPKFPLRNQISSEQAAKLMSRIINKSSFNQKIYQYLTWDLASEQKRLNQVNPGEFNPILGFFGQGLPEDLIFLSKAGWTSETRSEVAYISTKDGAVAYILALITEHPQYSQDQEIFPAIAQLVHQAMVGLKIRAGEGGDGQSQRQDHD